jgi:hypothetical protein
MRRLLISAIAAAGLSTSVGAEIVQTIDGRTVDLREDGTYEILETAKQSDTDFVEYKDHFFAHHVSEYDRKRVRFMPIYTNVAEKKIVGAKFEARFLNAFGDEIFTFSGELDEPISPGKTSTNKLFYYFEDNQFISGEPYDKLLPMVTNKTGSIEVEMTTIAFEGGEIVKLTD